MNAHACGGTPSCMRTPSCVRTPFSKKRNCECIPNEQLSTHAWYKRLQCAVSLPQRKMMASATSTRTCIPIERSGAWPPHAECRARASAQDDGVGDVKVKGKLVIARRCFRRFDHSTAGQDGLLKSARKLKKRKKERYKIEIAI
jgi:hypothetical protein